jgi:hypothetical protein
MRRRRCPLAPQSSGKLFGRGVAAAFFCNSCPTRNVLVADQIRINDYDMQRYRVTVHAAEFREVLRRFARTR